jgi:hypothetical protein
MRVVILYRPRSEHEGKVLDFVRDYKHINKQELELVSTDSRNGAHLGELYGITQYPAVLAIAGDGSLQRFWQGEHLPLMNEVQYYTRST